jgi:ACR3 family arsenite transporter
VLFGFEPGTALATVVGVLIKVPVMLAAVRVVNSTGDWYERALGIVPHESCCPPAASLHTQAS